MEQGRAAVLRKEGAEVGWEGRRQKNCSKAIAVVDACLKGSM
jgi:hypothetical protein